MSEERLDDGKWYVLRAVSGKENKIKQAIESEVRRSKWSDIISQVLMPTEKVYQIKNGKKIVKERNFFPGYLMLETSVERLHGDILQTITSINGVVHFLGKENPIPLRKSEVDRILGKVDEMQDSGETMTEPFLVGELVKIIDGPFNDFKGYVESINAEKMKVKVMVSIFGRSTPVELDFLQISQEEKTN